MTPGLTTNYAKNYGNRTLIVKVIVENVVTCFLGGHSVVTYVDMFSLLPVNIQKDVYEYSQDPTCENSYISIVPKFVS